MSDKRKASKSAYARAARKQAQREDRAVKRYEQVQDEKSYGARRWAEQPQNQTPQRGDVSR